MDFRSKIQLFMQGRYGNDELNRFLSVVILILLIFCMITNWYVLTLLSLALCIWSCFRTFSRNIGSRYAENQKFLQMTAPVRQWFRDKKSSRHSAYRIFSCPQCKQRLRVPKGKGKIEITCPKCRQNFIKRS